MNFDKSKEKEKCHFIISGSFSEMFGYGLKKKIQKVIILITIVTINSIYYLHFLVILI